jgi:hypothetical protein
MTEAKKEHPHAEFLRALADGASLSEFLIDGANVETFHSAFIRLILTGEATATITRKPKTRIINGFEVPAPETEAPKNGERLFIAAVDIEPYAYTCTWCANYSDQLFLKRGLVFRTEEAAVANAKAMLGIDPYADEQTHARAQADDTEGGEV